MRRLMSLLALFATALAHAAPTGLLNDTGQTTCYDGANMVACATGNTGDAATYPRQDARFGRDAKTGLAKTGAGAASFDFTKICWNGNPEGSGTCTGTLVANTTATTTGVTATDWACTRDNVTNLVWSLQSVSGVAWANATSTAGGSPINTANTDSRCGFNSGWRVPTQRELLSLVHRGLSSGAKIDTTYFPGTTSFYYWSNDAYAPDAASAWVVDFGYGYTYSFSKDGTYYVRLVRSGQ